MLFATLDPTMRRLGLPRPERNPIRHVASSPTCRPTSSPLPRHLEEVTEADIVVHVRDAHHPIARAARDVLAVLGNSALGATGKQPESALSKSG